MQQSQDRPAEQRVELTIDNLFELMFVFTKKGIDAKCFDEAYEEQIKQCFEYFSGDESSLVPEDALNTIIRGYNITQEKGKYNLMDAFNVVQLVFFIQNNLEKVKEKILLNKKQKQEEKSKAAEDTAKGKEKEVEKEKTTEEDDLSELTEPIPLKGKIVSI